MAVRADVQVFLCQLDYVLLTLK